MTLCEMDSDLDGKTNGEELGDPNCAFQEGGIPHRNISLSHPGKNWETHTVFQEGGISQRNISLSHSHSP